ncbi:MAG: TetR/AcrR family transcriptional regulator [Spirochaetia bacterium]|nr:TetR/AcrR family transcriptional regulator [Spirochaetia bacterium]MCF7942146.1 TetR/AcrR family transcriptional regulator [Spirochaetia bacterium]
MKALTARQQEIIQSSLKLITEGGIQHLTIKALSASLGVSEPAIYRHFSSKQEILLTLLQILEDDNLRFRQTIASEKPSIRHIAGMFSRQGQLFMHNRELSSIIFSEEIFQNNRELSQKVLQISTERHEIVRSIIISAQQQREIRTDIDSRQITLMIIGSLRLVVLTWRLSDFGFDLAEELSASWEALFKMLS